MQCTAMFFVVERIWSKLLRSLFFRNLTKKDFITIKWPDESLSEKPTVDRIPLCCHIVGCFSYCIYSIVCSSWLLIHRVVRIELMSLPVAPLACWLSICLSVWLYNCSTRARNVPHPGQTLDTFLGEGIWRALGSLAQPTNYPEILE